MHSSGGYKKEQAHIPVSEMACATQNKPVPDAGLERLVVRLELGVVVDERPGPAAGCAGHSVDVWVWLEKWGGYERKQRHPSLSSMDKVS